MPVLQFASATPDDLFTVPDLNRVTGNRTTVAQELEIKLRRYEVARAKPKQAQATIEVQDQEEERAEAAQEIEFWEGGVMPAYEPPPPTIPIVEEKLVADKGRDFMPSRPDVESMNREGGGYTEAFARSDRRRNGKPLVTSFDMLHKRSLDPAELSDEDRAALIEIERERETREVIPCRYVLDMDGGLFVWKLRLVPIPMPSQAWTAISGLPIGGESDGYVMPEAIPGEYEHIINSRKPDPIRTYYAPGLGILEKLRHRAIKKAMAALVEFVEDISEIDKETKRILRESGLAG